MLFVNEIVLTHIKIFKTSFLGASYYLRFNQIVKTSKQKERLEMYHLDHDTSIVIDVSNNNGNSSSEKEKIKIIIIMSVMGITRAKKKKKNNERKGT